MGLTVDALSKATPTRLICRGGRWMLELTRLEAVDRDVFQPRLTRLEGADSILAALRRSEDGQGLVSAAAQLMRSPRPDEDRMFDVADGDFVPSSESVPLERGGASRQHDSETADLHSALVELRAELVVLRASHARLRERVMALEAAQSGLPQGGLRPPRGIRNARRRSEPPPPVAPLAPEAVVLPAESPAAFAATQASPALAAPPVPAAPPGAAAVPAPTFEELAKQVAGEQLPPVLTPPSLADLNSCMSTLMDKAPPLVVLKTPVNLATLLQPQGCKLLDDEGKERGMIVLDLTAAVLLGAALLSLPRAEAQRQINDNEPSEDALLATSEICNNITGPVNAVPGNAHVRSTALSSVDVGNLARARSRLDLSADGGYLILLMF